MNTDNIQQTNNFNEQGFPSVPSVSEEKYSNIKMIDQKINQYKESPFEGRKSQRKDFANDGSSIKKSKNDANSQFSQSSQKSNKNLESFNQPNKNYIKMKTQPNVQPKIAFQKNMSQNPQFTKASRQMTLINKNQIIQGSTPTQINNSNIVVKNRIPQQNDTNETNQINSQINNQNVDIVDNSNIAQDTVQHKLPNRQKYHEEQIYQINDGPDNGKGKVRKIKVEITREQSITGNETDDFDNGLKYVNNKNIPKELNENKLSNVSFSNKNFFINKKKKQKC